MVCKILLQESNAYLALHYCLPQTREIPQILKMSAIDFPPFSFLNVETTACSWKDDECCHLPRN